MNIPFWTVGRTIDLAALTPEDVTIEILADTLAKVNRFGGRTPEPFSVAAHSVLVERLCPPDLRPWALLHDAHEAFLGDIVEPAVWMIARCAQEPDHIVPAVARAKGVIDQAIGSAWGVPVRSVSRPLRLADRIALEAEAFVFLGKHPACNLEPEGGSLLDSAIEMVRELLTGSDWRTARDLWLSRVEHYASLGRMSPPRATVSASMVPAGKPEGEMEW